MYVYDCLGAGTKAIQVVFFKAASCNSGLVEIIYANKEMAQQAAPHIISVSNLIPGEVYYILIDGYSNKNCGYTFVAIDGVSTCLDVNVSAYTVCAGGGVTATATGGSTYAWTGQGLSATTGSNLTITPPSTPGTYNYKVTSTGSTSGGIAACATSNEQEFSITVVDAVTPTFTNPGPICQGGTFTLPTTSTNGVTGTWSPAINNNQTTIYTFTPTSTGCTAPVTMEVLVGDSEKAIAIGNQVICEGGAIQPIVLSG